MDEKKLTGRFPCCFKLLDFAVKHRAKTNAASFVVWLTTSDVCESPVQLFLLDELKKVGDFSRRHFAVEIALEKVPAFLENSLSTN